MHRRLYVCLTGSDAGTVGSSLELPSLPVDAPTGGAWFSSLTLAKRRRFLRYNTLATASRAHARKHHFDGLGMHWAHRCRTRRNTDNFTFSYALSSNRNDINGLRDFRTTHNIYYVKLLRKRREIPPPPSADPGVVLVQPHTHVPLKFCPPGHPYRTLRATEKNYGRTTQAQGGTRVHREERRRAIPH